LFSIFYVGLKVVGPKSGLCPEKKFSHQELIPTTETSI
jgi:hypothetical protein